MRNSILKLFHYFLKLNSLILGSGGDYRRVHSFLIHTGQNVLKLIPSDFVSFSKILHINSCSNSYLILCGAKCDKNFEWKVLGSEEREESTLFFLLILDISEDRENKLCVWFLLVYICIPVYIHIHEYVYGERCKDREKEN